MANDSQHFLAGKYTLPVTVTAKKTYLFSTINKGQKINAQVIKLNPFIYSSFFLTKLISV